MRRLHLLVLGGALLVASGCYASHERGGRRDAGPAWESCADYRRGGEPGQPCAPSFSECVLEHVIDPCQRVRASCAAGAVVERTSLCDGGR